MKIRLLFLTCLFLMFVSPSYSSGIQAARLAQFGNATVIGAKGVWLRQAPSTQAAQIRLLNRGTPLLVQGRNTDSTWLNVQLADGAQGWAYHSFIGYNNSIGALPVLTSNSTAPAALPNVAQPTAIAPAPVVTNPTVAAPAAVMETTGLPRVAIGSGTVAASNGVWVRQAPQSGSTAITLLPKGATVNLYAKYGETGWVYVSWAGGQSGWTARKYINSSVALYQLPNVSPNALVANSGATSVNLPPPIAQPTAQPIAQPTAQSNVANLPPPPPPPPPTAVIPPTPVPTPLPPSYPLDSYKGNIRPDVLRQIFARGQATDKRANVFSKIGDSMTAGRYSSYLSMIGHWQYDLDSYSYLQPTVDLYMSGETIPGFNAFNHISFAAGNGWLASSLLAESVPGCESGEAPVACEYRRSKPSVALIMIGTNDSGGVPLADYRAQLQQIIQISLDNGVIPVLSTLPPKRLNPLVDGRIESEFNPTILNLAQEYGLPYIDLWGALQQPGVQALAPDGVHVAEPPSGKPTYFWPQNMYYAATIRNVLTLQMLTLLRQALGY